MLSRRAAGLRHLQWRRSYSSATRFAPVPVLRDSTVETFRKHAFEPALPALLPRGSFEDLPAVGKWFIKSGDGEYCRLNAQYLAAYKDTLVPLEVSVEERFERVQGSLGTFVE